MTGIPVKLDDSVPLGRIFLVPPRRPKEALEDWARRVGVIVNVDESSIPSGVKP